MPPMRVRVVSSLLWMAVCGVLRVSMHSKDPLAVVLWALLLSLTMFIVEGPEGARTHLSHLLHERKELREEVHNIAPRNDDNVCLITQNAIKELAVVPCCHRGFEKSALKEWLQTSSTCPNCRASVDKVYVRA